MDVRGCVWVCVGVCGCVSGPIWSCLVVSVALRVGVFVFCFAETMEFWSVRFGRENPIESSRFTSLLRLLSVSVRSGNTGTTYTDRRTDRQTDRQR